MRSSGNLSDNLKKLNTFGNVQLVPSFNATEPKHGAFNNIFFMDVHGIHCQYNNTTWLASPFSVAVSIPLKPLFEGDRKPYLATQLAYRRQVPFDFMHQYLYQDDQGLNVSEKADEDLIDYLKTKRPTLQELKSLLGQIVLGIDDFHQRNLVHRDIKPDNILLVKRGNHVIAKIADLDTLAEVSITGRCADTLRYCGTREYFSKAMLDYIYNRSVQGKKYHYSDFNLYAEDCYAFGRLCWLALNMFLFDNHKAKFCHKRLCFLVANEDKKTFDAHPDIKECYQLGVLVSKLLCEDASQRITISQVKSDIFFGLTETARNHFFNDLRLAAKQPLIIDNYNTWEISAELNNPFLLLNRRLKEVIVTISALNISLNQLKFNFIHPAPIQFACFNATMTDLLRSFKTSNHLIDQVSVRNQNDLNELKATLAQEDQEAVSRIEKCNSAMLMERVDAQYALIFSRQAWRNANREGFFVTDYVSEVRLFQSMYARLESCQKDGKPFVEQLALLCEFIHYQGAEPAVGTIRHKLKGELEFLLKKSFADINSFCLAVPRY